MAAAAVEEAQQGSQTVPWAPADVDPWDGLLWANGRRPLDDLPPERDWLWQCAPLDEWDGTIRRL